MFIGLAPAPLFAPTDTFTGLLKLPVEGLIVPCADASTGADKVQVAMPLAIVPFAKLIVLPEMVPVPPQEFVTVAPAGKFKPEGNV